MQFGPGLSTTHPDHFTGNRETDCYTQWRKDREQAIMLYEKCKQTPGWNCNDPRQDPSMDYENYKRERCR